jgi:Fic family protein
MHVRLLERVRGRDKSRGELRTGQVWIGSEGTTLEEARFVPPPAEYVRDLLTDWELFLNEDIEMPPLVQCALMHYQFETIHPYLDGNGRIGRLLITLFLCAKEVLPTPLLYLSAYFERRRDEYYDHLLAVSQRGSWQDWVRFFLRGVAEQAQDALLRSRRVRQLQDRYRGLLQERGESGNAFRLLDELFANPFMTTPLASHLLSVTSAGARGILQRLVDAGVVEEISGTWPKFYVARELLEAIEQPVASEGS